MRRGRVVVAVAAALSLVSCGGSSGSADDTSWPSVELVADDGSEVASSDVLADGVTVVNLWATWCGPCKREMPMLQELSAEGVAVVGVNIGDQPDAVDDFLAEYSVTFPNYIDGDGVLTSELDIPSVPATLVVVGGQIVWENLGEVTREAIDSALADADA